MKFGEDLLPPPLPDRFSASFIGSTTECILRARFAREADTGGMFATIGSAAHEVFATAGLLAQFQGLMKIYPRQAHDIALRVLGNPEEAAHLPYWQHKFVTEMAERWAEHVDFPVDADEWVIEHPWRHPLVDAERDCVYTISGRNDEYAVWGTHVRIRDWKTGPKLPSRREVEEEHTQLPVYAWQVMSEKPWVDSVEGVEFYCRRGVPRPVQFDRSEFEELESWLIGRCRTIVDAWTRNDFEANPGERWCGTCPMPHRCPLPESVRMASIIEDEQDAEAMVQAWIVEEQRVKRRKGAVRGWLEGVGLETVTVGGKRYGFVPKQGRRTDDHRLNAMLALLGYTKEDFMVEEAGTEFGVRAA